MPRVLIPLLFSLSGALTIFVVRLAAGGIESQKVNWIEAWQSVILAILVGGAMFILFSRFAGRMLWEATFTLTIFFGVWFLLLVSRLPLEISLFMASLLTLIYLIWRRVLSHDIFFLIGSCGVAINIGAWASAELIMLILVGFSIYDMVAARPGGPMIELATRLIKMGVVPGFVLPAKTTDFFQHVTDSIKTKAALLGAGDVILPMALLTRSALSGAVPALSVLTGIVVGAVFLATRRDLRPRAALPPLAIGGLIPFLLLYLSRVIH